MEEVQTCKKCNKPWPLTFYPWNGPQRKGRKKVCKECYKKQRQVLERSKTKEQKLDANFLNQMDMKTGGGR